MALTKTHTQRISDANTHSSTFTATYTHAHYCCLQSDTVNKEVPKSSDYDAAGTNIYKCFDVHMHYTATGLYKHGQNTHTHTHTRSRADSVQYLRVSSLMKQQ